MHVASVLGLKAPEVHRIDEDEVYMTYVDRGTIGADYLDSAVERWAAKRAGASADDFYSKPDARRMGVLDVLISNEDRNTGNWFIDGDKITPIDHGAAFTHYHGFEFDQTPGTANDFNIPYVWYEEWKDNDLSRSWLVSLRPKLEALRPEFKRLGREQWLDDVVLTRLRVLIDHARGGLTL